MKKLLLALLAAFPLYTGSVLFFTDKTYFRSPLAAPYGLTVRIDTRGNGYFASPRRGSRVHRGVDLSAPVGTPVYAARSGLVTVTRNEEKGMGNYVVVRHGDGMTTLYGHLSEIRTVKGASVRQGEIIGLVGKTGNANTPAMTPHLHLEVKRGGIYRDPLEYVR